MGLLAGAYIMSTEAYAQGIRQEQRPDIRRSRIIESTTVANSTSSIEVVIPTKTYRLECGPLPVVSCVVAPKIQLGGDKIDIITGERAELGLYLSVCPPTQDRNGCKVDVPWGPGTIETDLSRNGVTCPGDYILRWSLGGNDFRAHSNPLHFFLDQPKGCLR
jgi:hypothetical protein